MADISKELNQIKNAVYGREVRGSIHDSIDKVNRESEGSRQIANNTEQRQDAVEQQFNTLLGEWSDDKPIDNAETIAARTNTKESKTYENLGKRLDEEYGKVTAQLEETDKQRHLESMINRKEPNGLFWSWVDDDAQLGVYTKLKKIAEEYGVIFTSAVITSRIGADRYMTEEQIKELHETGLFEFLSHTHWHDNNHRPVDMTEEELDYDFSTSQQIIKDMGYNSRGLVLPFANNSPLIQRVAKRYYDYVIGTGANKTGYPMTTSNIDNYYIRRVTVEYDWEFIKEQIDSAYEEGNAWIVFVSHVDQGDWYSESLIRQTIEYLLSLNFNSITTKEGIDRFGNIAQFGSNKISADGYIRSNELGVVVNDHSISINGYTPLSYFKNNALTRSKIRLNPGQLEGMPVELSGYLETNRLDEDLWAYQVFTTTRERIIYTRTWDTSIEEWNEWERNSAIIGLPQNSIGVNVPYTDRRLYRRNTACDITSSHASEYPESRAGTLYTFANDVFRYQEYQIYYSPKRYRRSWDNTSEKWSIWRLVDDTVNYFMVGMNEIQASDTIDQFEYGVTVGHVNSQGAAGFPGAGIITTYRTAPLSAGRFGYQEFKTLGNYDKYIRYVNSDGSWSVWKRFVLEDV